MKVALICLCALYNSISFGFKENYIADSAYLQKQIDILRLYNYVHYPSTYGDITEAAKSFKFDEDYDRWMDPKYPKEFLKHYYDLDFIKKEEVFSLFNAQHLKQAISLYRIMFYAREYETFFEIAAWSRQNINSGMFIFVLTSAVIHSKHTTDIKIPPMNEVNPYLFVENAIIGYYSNLPNMNGNKNVYLISQTFFENNTEIDSETLLGLFRNDTGFLTYYFYHMHLNAFWLSSNETFDGMPHRGENFYNYLQNILARYTLEMESYGLTEIPDLRYDAIKHFNFSIDFVYPSELTLPYRNQTNFLYIGEHYLKMKQYEERIQGAIDEGVVNSIYGPYSLYSSSDKERFGNFANLLQSNPDSVNQKYYGDILYHARKVLGNLTNTPGILEQLESSPRDPLFWQLMKRFFNFFIQYKSHLLPYKLHQLNFEGVKIDNIVSENVRTYFDYIYASLCKALKPTEIDFFENSCNIFIKQKVLHHRPFFYEMIILSQKSVDAFVKVFIGPYLANHGFLKENIIHFYELERFKISLNVGVNIINRTIDCSQEREFSYNEYFRRVLAALNRREELVVNSKSEGQWFPKRLKFPKGNETGQEFTLFAVVVPNDLESYPVGFPLDRPIETESVFVVPNFFMKSVVIENEYLIDDPPEYIRNIINHLKTYF